MKRVKVIKCSHKAFWYDDYIGEEFIVVGNESNDLLYNVVGMVGDRPRAFFKIDCDVISDPIKPTKHLKEKVEL